MLSPDKDESLASTTWSRRLVEPDKPNNEGHQEAAKRSEILGEEARTPFSNVLMEANIFEDMEEASTLLNVDCSYGYRATECN